MPNHIANVISGPSLAEIREALRGAEHAVDFNRLVPMPEGMGIEMHGGIEQAAEIACHDWPNTNAAGMEGVIARLHLSNMNKTKSPLSFRDDEWNMFVQALQNKRKHGHYSWYTWSREHWGTKWNAYSIAERDDALCFQTAWSFPEPIMRALIDRLPHVEFEWAYADEDYGSNLGIWTRSDGQLVFSEPDGDHQEWAMRMHGYDDKGIADYRAEIAADEAAEATSAAG